MRIFLAILVVAVAAGGAGAETPPEPHYFRARAAADVALGFPEGADVPIRAELPAGTSAAFRLEWTPDLAATGDWAVVALASASNEFAACDYVLPVAQPAEIRWSNTFASASWTQEWHVLADKDWGWTNLARVSEPGGRFETFLRASYPSNDLTPIFRTVGGRHFLS